MRTQFAAPLSAIVLSGSLLVACTTVNTGAPAEPRPNLENAQNRAPERQDSTSEKLDSLARAESSSECESPEWYADVPTDPRYLIASTTAVSADMQTAYDKATMQARVELGRQLETWTIDVQNAATLELQSEDADAFANVYSSVSRLITATSIRRSTVVERSPVCREGEVFRAFVLAVLPINQAKSDLFERLEKEDQRLFDQFQKTETGKRMKADVAAWDPSETYTVR